MFRSSIILWALCAVSLRAETFTIEGAVARALTANPDLAAARWSIEEARGRLMQSGRRPNPELETEAKPRVGGREFSLSAGFIQKYPLTNRLYLERAISTAGLRAAEAEVLDAARLLSAEVRTLAIQLQSVTALHRLRTARQKNSTALGGEASRAAQAGEGSALDAAQFELEARQLSLDLLQLEAERAALTARLNPLLGLPATGEVTVTGELSQPSPGADARPPLDQRADYRAAAAREEAARTGIELAKAGKWEDASYGLTAEWERSEDAPDGLGNDGFLGFKFSLPLPLWNKNEGRIHEAASAAEKAGREKDALAGRIRAEEAAARAAMAAAEKIAGGISTSLLPAAIKLEDAFTAAKAGGQAQSIDVLRAREKRLSLETARIEALRDYHLARVRLLSALGR